MGTLALVVDAGNTRVKWGWHDGHSWQGLGAVANSELETLDRVWTSAPTKIVISNVAGDAIAAKLSTLVSRWHVTPHWIRPGNCQCGVKNSYADPTQLGSDRWAALIGAWHLHRGASLVVNLGSAMTVDLLSDEGVFEGGIIVPGLELMHCAVVEKAANLSAQSGKFMVLPDNTADAITSGAIYALCGAIERMAQSAEQKLASAVSCILSGGDSGKISPYLKRANQVIDNLVLEGLVRIAASEG